MLDKYTMHWVAPATRFSARHLLGAGLHADHVTLCGFVIGMLAVPALAFEQYLLALLCLLGNRMCDGVDGAMARQQGASEAGGYLDIVLDFIFYAAFVLGFALADPQQNALMAALLITTFMGTGGSFLAFAAASAKYGLHNIHLPKKSFYYLEGLMEGTETIAFFVLFCLMPASFVWLAGLFAALCLLTTAVRVWGGYHTLRQLQAGARRSQP